MEDSEFVKTVANEFGKIAVGVDWQNEYLCGRVGFRE